jgi:hypothetical protein
MSKMKPELDLADKKTYEQPRVVTISLRPEEAVLSHCKMASASGPIGAACNLLIVQCSSIGS